MNKSSIDWEIPDFSFPEELRQSLLNAEYWNERYLEALCLGIPPKKYADTECCGTDAERKSVRARISAGIESGAGALYATRNPNAGRAERIYGGVWHIEPAHAVHWVISQIPQFSKFPEWLVSELQTRYGTQVAERRARGRYTLDEASTLIAEQKGWGDATRKKLRGQLMEAADAGLLHVHDPVTDAIVHPPAVCHFHEVVSHKDVNDWAALGGVFWRWNVTPEPQPERVVDVGAPGSVGPKLPNWRMQIQAEAYEKWIRLRASGCNPSVHSISDDMARWCVTQNIRGGKGQNPKAGTIRNTVLGAGHWTPPTHSVEQAKKHVAPIAQTAQTKVAQTA